MTTAATAATDNRELEGENMEKKSNSYAAMLTKKGGHDVIVVRFDGYRNKEEVMVSLYNNWPDYNIKTICKLYDEDFAE